MSAPDKYRIYDLDLEVSTLSNPVWILDKHSILNLVIWDDKNDSAIWVWVEERNYYCDRCHFLAHIEAHFFNLDGADCFPRAYMKLKTMKREILLFIDWRLNKNRAEPYGLLRGN